MKIRGRIAIVGAVAIILVMLLAASSLARPKAATPGQTVAAMIGTHNAVGTQIQDEYTGEVSSYSIALEQCHEVENSAGEPREIAEVALRETAKEHAKTTEIVYAEYNKDLPEAIGRIESSAGPLSKAKRSSLKHATRNLRKAHQEHSSETFHLHALWVDIEAVHCGDAEGEYREASVEGSGAWTTESGGLRELAGLFHVKRSVEFPFGPYISSP